MKKLLLIFLLVPGIIWGQPSKYQHNNKSYVDDFADIFNPEQEIQLDKIIHTYSDTVQILLVTVSDLNGYDVHDFAMELGNSWGVGGKSNNGVLILIAPKEHRYATITGGGVQGKLTDVWTGETQREVLVPAFRAGNYYKGCSDLLQAYITKLKPESIIIKDTENKLYKKDNSAWGYFLFFGFLGGIFIIWLIMRKRKKNIEPDYQTDYVEKPYIPTYYRSRHSYEDISYPPPSPKKSSSSDFGGGSFDGGGSSGSW